MGNMKKHLVLLFCLIGVYTRRMVNSEDDFDTGKDYVELNADIDELPAEYTEAVPSDPSSVYFYENFDDLDVAKKRWVFSRAQKEDQEGSKYDGVWDFQLPQRVIFGNDRALVLKSKAKHAAVAAKLDRPFEFKAKPLFIQYEVNFQNGMDCGGAYIKLLSYSKNLDLAKFTDKTPYVIMFGPDKCGNDFKLHFIFRHKSPITGEFEEKHASKPTNRLEENYSDKKPHSYLLKLFPDNTFQIFVDGNLVNNGHLLEDMTPSVNPPSEIADVNDKKPGDWDEREEILDVTAKKPDDWDEDLPVTIVDPNAVKPSGWLDDEELTIPDTTAEKPDDWDDGMDGEWEPPKINNPVCADASGCGPWTPPQIPNPAFKGKWKQPTIPNPNYKGKWAPRMIPNIDYFDDKEPFKMTSIGAIGIEIWAMTDLILFDNFVITDNEKALQDWNAKTYDLKKRIIDKDSKSWYGKLMRKINYHRGAWTIYSIYCLVPFVAYLCYLWILYKEEGVLSRTFNYTNAHPWLWAVYILVIGLPLVLILTFCCGGSQEKRDQARNKKTDEYVADDDEPEETVNETTENVADTVGGSRVSPAPVSPDRNRSREKEDLELDVGAMGDNALVDDYEDEDDDAESGVSDPLGQATTESDSETDFRPHSLSRVTNTSATATRQRMRRVD